MKIFVNKSPVSTEDEQRLGHSAVLAKQALNFYKAPPMASARDCDE